MTGQLEPQLLLIDKPAGPTSHDIVATIRRDLRPEHDGKLLIGHAGTLDPFATGLLIILVGAATKTQAEFMGSDKRYQTTLKLGQQTDTGDLTGQVVTEKPVPPITEPQIAEIFATWPSPFTQPVPAYAAAKVGGRKLYEYARAGETPPWSPIRVCRAADWQLESWDAATHELTFSVTVSAGCYIRALGDAIAAKLGTVGHLIALRRLSSGTFSVEEATPPVGSTSPKA